MADVAITNGRVIVKKDLRLANFVGTVSTANETLVAAVSDKQIVVWKYGGSRDNGATLINLIEGTTTVIPNNAGVGDQLYTDFGDTPYVLPTNTLLAFDISGSTQVGGYWVIYSLIDPIDRT